MPSLLINGIVENRGENLLDLPAIRAELVAEDGVLASTFIEPPVVQIEGGHSHGFSARMPHPGGKLPELKLSFAPPDASRRSEEHTSELQSLMRISYAVFCLTKQKDEVVIFKNQK